MMNRKYQIFSKKAYTEFDEGDKSLKPILFAWFNRNKRTMIRLTWNRYKIDDNNYITYLCAVYKKEGKTYQKNLPEGFNKHDEQGKDLILNIELGFLHPGNLEFKQELIIKKQFRQKYIDKINELKKANIPLK